VLVNGRRTGSAAAVEWQCGEWGHAVGDYDFVWKDASAATVSTLQSTGLILDAGDYTNSGNEEEHAVTGLEHASVRLQHSTVHGNDKRLRVYPQVIVCDHSEHIMRHKL